jgi:hypothetical protein
MAEATYASPRALKGGGWHRAKARSCQNNLETGDVIEVLPSLVFPITIHGFTYHPQNEAMLQ